MTHRPRISVRLIDVTKTFGTVCALNRVTFESSSGEVVALLGENGSGKSTLAKIIAGVLQPDSGSVEIDGRIFRPSGPHEASSVGVALIHQELALAPHLTVAENISLGLESTWHGLLDRKRQRAVAEHVLTQLDATHIPVDHKAGTLPISSQQLVEIARGLASGARLIIFDEPTASLSTKDATRLIQIIRELRMEGIGVIYISHNLAEALSVADRVVVVRDGYAVADMPAAEATTEQLVMLMVNREVTEFYPRNPRTQGEPILSLDDLAGIRKPVSANLVLFRGEILGIYGLVGSGRTELLRCIFGLDPVNSGRIRIGVHVGAFSPAHAWAIGMGFLSEDRKNEGLALDLSVACNMTLNSMRTFATYGWLNREKLGAAAQRFIKSLRIRCSGPEAPVATLSGGNQQKVALARLLQKDVDVLLLDEPTKGIDIAAKTEIYDILDRLVAPADGRKAKAVVFVSSYLPELFGVCDRIAVMNRGYLGSARLVSNTAAEVVFAEATAEVMTADNSE